MAEKLGRVAVIAYLDTHVAAALAQGEQRKLPRAARQIIQKRSLRISPMALLELGYLYEIHRTVVPAVQVAAKLQAELGVEVCDFPFSKIAYAALGESWTRDAFDRTIVAHARANGTAPLITSDRKIQANYAEAVWDD
jgi:PIN domain nuclease of toxin-antitoxin system